MWYVLVVCCECDVVVAVCCVPCCARTYDLRAAYDRPDQARMPRAVD